METDFGPANLYGGCRWKTTRFQTWNQS